MNRQEAKELLPIIQAFAEGKKKIEVRVGNNRWTETDEVKYIFIKTVILRTRK